MSNGQKQADHWTALEQWFTPGRFAAGLGLLIFASFSPVLLGRETFFFRDYAIFGYPLAHYHKQAFWNGELPLWNSLNHCGLPFLAQWNTLVFYPLSLIYLLLPMPWSLSFFCLFHLFLAGLGMYYLARRWSGSQFAGSAAGVAFAFSGLMLSCLKWPNNMAGLGLFPWVVFALDRAWAGERYGVIAAALVSATQLLSGAPEMIFVTWMLAGFLGLRRFCVEKERRVEIVLKSTAIIVLAAGLAAPQLLPFLDLLRHSQRDAAFSGSAWAMPLSGWANFFLPLFGSIPSHHGVYAQTGQYWVSSYYVALPATLLAVCAAGRKMGSLSAALLGAAVFSFVVSLGEAGFVYSFLRQWVPGFGLMRFPVKFAALTASLLPLVGAMALARSRSGEGLRQRFYVLSGFAVLLIGGLILYARGRTGTGPEPGVLLQNGLERAGVVALGAGLLFGLSKSPGTARLSALGFCLLLWLDVMRHAPWQNPTVPGWVYQSIPIEMAPVPKEGQNRALISPLAEFRLDHILFTSPVNDCLTGRLALFCNANLLDGIPKINGFYSLLLKHEARLDNLFYGSTNAFYPGLWRFMGVSQISTAMKPIDWAPQTNALPWVTTGQKIVFAEDEQIFSEITGSGWDPAKVVFLPPEAKDQIQITNHQTGRILSSRFARSTIEIDYSAGAPSLLTLSQAFYHRWHAYVDEKEIPLFRANYAFQAMAVPAGRHRVKLVYRDSALGAGLVLALASCAALALVFWRESRRTN